MGPEEIRKKVLFGRMYYKVSQSQFFHNYSKFLVMVWLGLDTKKYLMTKTSRHLKQEITLSLIILGWVSFYFCGSQLCVLILGIDQSGF